MAESPLGLMLLVFSGSEHIKRACAESIEAQRRPFVCAQRTEMLFVQPQWRSGMKEILLLQNLVELCQFLQVKYLHQAGNESDSSGQQSPKTNRVIHCLRLQPL